MLRDYLLFFEHSHSWQYLPCPYCYFEFLYSCCCWCCNDSCCILLLISWKIVFRWSRAVCFVKKKSSTLFIKTESLRFCKRFLTSGIHWLFWKLSFCHFIFLKHLSLTVLLETFLLEPFPYWFHCRLGDISLHFIIFIVRFFSLQCLLAFSYCYVIFV